LKKLFITLLSFGGLIIAIFLIAPKIVSAHDHPRSTSYTCTRGFYDTGITGIFPNGTGTRYKVVEFHYNGNDNANWTWNESGSLLPPFGCGYENAVVPIIWGSAGDNSNFTFRPNLLPWSASDPKVPMDIFLGTPRGVSLGSAPSMPAWIGTGSPLYRINYNITKDDADNTHFAEINDAGGLYINDNRIWCVGLNSDNGSGPVDPGCVGDVKGPETGQQFPGLGCDCWGYLDTPLTNLLGVNPNVVNPSYAGIINNNVSMVGRAGITGVGAGVNRVVQPFKLHLNSANTHDPWLNAEVPGGVPGPNDPLIVKNLIARLTLVYPPNFYDLTPTREIVDDGKRVKFTVENTGDGDSIRANGAGVSYVRQIWRNGVLVFNNTYNKIFSPYSTFEETVDVPGASPGDTVCAYVSTFTSVGRTNGGYTVGLRSNGGNNVNCVTIKEKPYFRAYGNDVIVGRKFEQDDGTCDINKNSSSIKAYVRGTAGSGSQFAASASNEIDGFMSSANHAGSGSIASPHFGLSFGNYDGLTPVADYPAGKDVSAYSGCILNYWESKGLNGNNIGPEVPVTESQGNLDSLAAGQIWHSEGDVHIQYNLSYTTGPNISGSEGIIGARGLMIVVRGGNITIAPNVDRIDAILIAMPDSDGNGGIVDTCYAENVAYSDCLDKKLTINGAVVAKKINLNRLKGDVANAGENELPSDNNIAEVINFPAYLYPAYAGSNAASGTFGTLGKYDAISGLPPVL
jgi:hypothetical protein